MSERAGDNRATAESVSPKIYIPAVTVITVFVLIVFAVAVFVILRAYKRRQRHRRMYRSGLDVETAYMGPSAWRRGVWENESVRSQREAAQLAKGPFVTVQPRRDPGISIPERAVAPTPSRSAWNSRFPIKEQFRRPRVPMNSPVTTVDIEESDISSSQQDSAGVHVAEITLGIAPGKPKTVPKLSKLERMTGSKLSNDLYEERKSGQRETRPDLLAQRRKVHSYPIVNTNLQQERQSISLDTSISPTTTVWSPDFSPENPGVGLTALAPPPPPISITRIAADYPNIAALAQANIRVAEDMRRHERDPSQVSSVITDAGNQHIASQFNPTKRDRFLSGQSTQSSAAQSRSRRHMPKSGAFGQPDLHRYGTISSRVSNRTSISTFHHQVPPVPLLPPDLRHSWNGRSVLFLDPPPPPPEPAAELTRTQSISSMPSSISSFNTIHPITVLSPTPAPRTPKISQDDASTISNRKMRREEDEDIENQPARSSFGFL